MALEQILAKVILCVTFVTAFGVFAGVIIKLRAGGKRAEAAAFAVTSAFGVLAFCLGPVVQFILIQTFYSSTPGQYAHGLTYELEFHPDDILDSIYQGFLTPFNVLSGVILSLSIWLIRERESSVSAMLSASLILMVGDVLILTTNSLSSGYFAILTSYNGLSASLVCDIFGGAIVGYLCRIAFNRTKKLALNNGVKTAIREMSFTTLKLLFSGAIGALLIYFVFIWPEPETISASLSEVNGLNVKYADEAFWTVATSQVSLLGTPSIGVNAVGGTPATAKIVQTVGCQSDEDAMQVARTSEQLSYGVMGSSLEIGVPALGTTRLLSSRKDAFGILTMQAGDQAVGTVLSPGNFTTGFIGRSKLTLSSGAWVIVVDEATNGLIVDIDVSKDKENYSLIPQMPEKPKTECQAVALKPSSHAADWRLITPTQYIEQPPGDRVIVFMPDRGAAPYVPMPGVSIEFPTKPDGSPGGVLGWPVGQIEEFGSSGTDGTVSVGTRTFDKISTLFVGGNLVQLNWDPAGHLILTGTSNFVVANDDLVTLSLFGHLPDVIQGLLLSGFFGFLLWLQPKLRDQLLRFFKGNYP